MRVNKYPIVSLSLLLASNNSFIQIQLEAGRRADWYSPWQVAPQWRAGKRGMGGKMAELQVGSPPTASVVPVSDQVTHNTCCLQVSLAFLLGQISLPAFV